MTRRLALLVLLVTPLLARADGTSTTELWAPSRPMRGVSSNVSTFGDQVCYAWVPPMGIANATRIAWYVSTGLGVGKVCTMTVYVADGSSQVVTTGPQDCSVAGLVVVSGLAPFSLSGGTKYQVCSCGTAGITYSGPSEGPFNQLRETRNGLTTPTQTGSANSCTAGVAPATTGALSPTLLNRWFVRFGTTTP